MKSASKQLHKYDLIKPLAGFKPLGPISHFEIQPVKQYDDYCELCNYGDEDFWFIYVRYVPSNSNKASGGVDCIADCADYEAARGIASLVAGLLDVELVGL
jgi:hypothetical protein